MPYPKRKKIEKKYILVIPKRVYNLRHYTNNADIILYSFSLRLKH